MKKLSTNPLSISLLLNWSGQRLVYADDMDPAITPQTSIFDAISLLMSASPTPLSAEVSARLFKSGRLRNVRETMKLCDSNGKLMRDIGCVGGEGGYHLSLSLDVTAAEQSDSQSPPPPVVPRSVEPVRPPGAAGIPSVREFIKKEIFGLDLLSSSLVPPFVLFMRYIDNILKTPNTLEYKNRRTINTANKTFQSKIISFDVMVRTFRVSFGLFCPLLLFLSVSLSLCLSLSLTLCHSLSLCVSLAFLFRFF